MSNIVGSDIKNKLGEIYNHDHIFKNYSKMYIEKNIYIISMVARIKQMMVLL